MLLNYFTNYTFLVFVSCASSAFLKISVILDLRVLGGEQGGRELPHRQVYSTVLQYL
jgi:hypothetical protein